MEKNHTLSFEKKTSAVTLSDMEIFIFPELMIAGALANLMSPIIWEWRNDTFFKDIDKLSEYKKIQRVKQYIIDNFVFNLDIETWGLTTKSKEMKRFASFINFDEVMRHNALMGYEGDKYYYDINIRKFFGLDKYVDDNIPYWKTETVEAMCAFKRKEGYNTGAGECVSLSMLYFAALHIVAKIPFDKLFMMATPLHSQNFVDIGDGILTNNRRIVTKNMWFNGTELSSKARRALYNEKVTIVSNLSGYIHTMYDTATMPKSSYNKFETAIKGYLKSDINFAHFLCFFEAHENWRDKFYFSVNVKGRKLYASVASVFEKIKEDNLELSASIVKKTAKNMSDKLLEKVPEKTFVISEDMNQVYANLNVKDFSEWKGIFKKAFEGIDEKTLANFTDDFIKFSFLSPKLPSENKNFKMDIDLSELEYCDSAKEIRDYLSKYRGKNDLVDLAFLAFRDIDKQSWPAFLEAALKRNPVSVAALQNKSNEEIYKIIKAYDDKSIYSENRLAQPDEVFNFKTGDGIEKAVLFWNVLDSKNHDANAEIIVENSKVELKHEGYKYAFPSKKSFKI